MRRIAKTHNHTLKDSGFFYCTRVGGQKYGTVALTQQIKSTLEIKARIRARGTRGENWYSDRRAEWARKKARTQALWYLQLAKDFHGILETETPHPRQHLMRCMLVSNVDVEQRFANGTMRMRQLVHILSQSRFARIAHKRTPRYRRQDTQTN